MEFLRSRKLLALLFCGSALGFSRFNVGDIDGKPLTCGGAIYSEQIKKNVLGENPDVPVSLIARYPFRKWYVKKLSDIHVYCAIVLVAVVVVQLLRPKPDQPGYEASHIWRGRIVSWGLSPHYVLIGCILNYYAINLDVEEWRIAPGLSDWRMQVSYIIPFALNVLVAMLMGFFLCRYSFMPQWTATYIKYISAFSMVFWLTIGVYQTGAQAFRIGYGIFLLDPKVAIPGGSDEKEIYDKVQGFFNDLNMLVLVLGSLQCGQDLVHYKVLSRVEATGLREIAWVDMHKWAMLDLSYQALAIFSVFFAYMPWCLVGLPSWTCWTSPFLAAPLISVFFLPLLPYIKWIFDFISALFGAPEAIVAFSAKRHKWDWNFNMGQDADARQIELMAMQ